MATVKESFSKENEDISSPNLGKVQTPRSDRVSYLDKENTPVEKMKTSRNGTPLLSSNGRVRGQFKIISDDEIAAINWEKSVGKKVKSGKRRSLAPLQQSTEGTNILTGSGRNLSIKESFLNKKNTKISEEKSELQQKNVEKEKDTIVNRDDIEDPLIEDALTLMRSTESAGESYWQSMAEERRVALQEALTENEQLYDEIEKLQAENEKLKGNLTELEGYKLLYLSLQDETSATNETNVTTESAD